MWGMMRHMIIEREYERRHLARLEYLDDGIEKFNKSSFERGSKSKIVPRTDKKAYSSEEIDKIRSTKLIKEEKKLIKEEKKENDNYLESYDL